MGARTLALGARLEIRQGQGLVITPQLQQAIKLLQLSNIELDAFVDAELERNPLLARGDGDAGGERAVEPDSGSDEGAGDGGAGAALDVPCEESPPGGRATGDAREPAADVGGTVDWSRAGSGASG